MRIVSVVVVLLVGGCYVDNNRFCPGLPDNDCNNLDGARCASDEDCRDQPGTPRCEVSSGTSVCVQCRESVDCGDVTPVCSNENRCVGCREDDDCSSNACLETGACADESRVIYVVSNGANTADCGSRINQCSLEQALINADATRNIVRLNRSAYMVNSGLTIDKTVTLIARDSLISRSTVGAIITVDGSQTFKLVGGAIVGETANHSIECRPNAALQVHEAVIEGAAPGRVGIFTDSCELTVSRSLIRRNAGGGISMINAPRKATITNNFIVQNGGPDSGVGGMRLLATSDSLIVFNTIVDNVAENNIGAAGGFSCESGTASAPYNLVYRNSGGPGGTTEVAGSCSFEQSFVLHGAPGENVVRFANPNSPLPDYHLTLDSPPDVRNAVECATTVDFDGDRRPVDGRCDVGADEVAP